MSRYAKPFPDDEYPPHNWAQETQDTDTETKTESWTDEAIDQGIVEAKMELNKKRKKKRKACYEGCPCEDEESCEECDPLTDESTVCTKKLRIIKGKPCPPPCPPSTPVLGNLSDENAEANSIKGKSKERSFEFSQGASSHNKMNKGKDNLPYDYTERYFGASKPSEYIKGNDKGNDKGKDNLLIEYTEGNYIKGKDIKGKGKEKGGASAMEHQPWSISHGKKGCRSGSDKKGKAKEKGKDNLQGRPWKGKGIEEDVFADRRNKEVPCWSQRRNMRTGKVWDIHECPCCGWTSSMRHKLLDDDETNGFFENPR